MADKPERRKIEVDHPDWMAVAVKVLSGLVTLFGLAAWYFASMAIKTKDDFNKFQSTTEQKMITMESNFNLKMTNEIGRSTAKDDNQQLGIDENDASIKAIRSALSDRNREIGEIKTSIKYLHGEK